MKLSIPLAALALASGANASLILYGLCQTACNLGVVTCVVSAGFTMGPAGLAAAPWCSAIQGTCMGACALAFLIPAP